MQQIRIAFDGDAVLFSKESEMIYQQQGLEAFIDHEQKNAQAAATRGPLRKTAERRCRSCNSISTAATGNRVRPSGPRWVTARNSPAHERVIRTLRTWKVRIDETFFLGGVPKHKILESFSPHIFFDDQHQHCEGASRVVPTARVPHKD